MAKKLNEASETFWDRLFPNEPSRLDEEISSILEYKKCVTEPSSTTEEQNWFYSGDGASFFVPEASTEVETTTSGSLFSSHDSEFLNF